MFLAMTILFLKIYVLITITQLNSLSKSVLLVEKIMVWLKTFIITSIIDHILSILLKLIIFKFDFDDMGPFPFYEVFGTGVRVLLIYAYNKKIKELI